MRKLFLITFTALILSTPTTQAQKQIIIQKNERVMTAFWLGDAIVYKLHSGETKTGFINRIEEFYFIVDKDSVLYMNVKSVQFNRTTFLNIAGSVMVMAGAAYFLIDQFNVMVVHDEKFDVSGDTWKPSAMLVGLGLPLKYIRRKFQPVGRKLKMRAVDKDSPFYQWERNLNRQKITTGSN